jgi:hypothetical protein
VLAVVIGMLAFLVLLFGAAALFARRSSDPHHALIGTPPPPNSHTAFIAYSEPDARPHESSGRRRVRAQKKDPGPRAP